MKTSIICTLICLCFLGGWIWSGGCSGKGIVSVPGWPDGVALCDNNKNPVVYTSDAVLWADGVAMYTINKGHGHDPQVKTLIHLAHEICPLYKENNK